MWSEQFFIFRDNSDMQTAQFRTVLKKMIGKVGLDPANYDTHSFHISRATDLFKMGNPIESIKKFGRWCSNSIYKYSRDC